MDLGVIIHKSAKPSRQSAHVEAEKEANLTVGTIRTPPPWYLNLFGYPITIVPVQSLE